MDITAERAKYGLPPLAGSTNSPSVSSVQPTQTISQPVDANIDVNLERSKYGLPPLKGQVSPVTQTTQTNPAKTAKESAQALTKMSGIGALEDVGVGIASSLGNMGAGIVKGGLNLIGADSAANKVENFRQKAFENPTLVDEQSLDSTAGKVGGVVGDVLPYVIPGGGLVTQVAKDSLIGFGQSQGDVKQGLLSGGITAATGGLSKIPGAKESASKIVKGVRGTVDALAPGYTADDISGLGGNRGEDRTGANAFIPGAGTLLTGTAGAAIAGTKKVGQSLNKNNAIDELEKTYDDLFNSQTIGKTKKYNQSKKVTEIKNKAGTEGTNPARTLAESGTIPKQKGNRLDTIEQADEFRKQSIPLKEANTQALKELETKVPKANLFDLEELAVKEAKTAKNIASGDAKAMEKQIRQDYSDYREAFGDEIPLSKIDEIKSARADKAFGNKGLVDADVLKKNTDYSISTSLRKYIERVSKEAGYEEVAQLNRHIGDNLEAAKFLEGLHNKVIRGGNLTKLVYGAVGSTMASNPLTKVLAFAGGEAVANVLMNLKIAGPVRRMVLRNIQKKDPIAYTKALKWLTEQGLAKDLELSVQKRLPAPKSKVAGNGKTIQLPKDTASTVESREAVARSNKYKIGDKAVTQKAEEIIDINKDLSKADRRIVMDDLKDSDPKAYKEVVEYENLQRYLNSNDETNILTGKNKSILQRIKDTPNKQGGFAKNPFVRKNDPLIDKVSEAIDSISTDPVKVDGKLEFGNVDDAFELDKAKERINKPKPLTVEEAEAYVPLLKRNGIDVYSELDNAITKVDDVDTLLINEAKKYKTAEEFQRANPVIEIPLDISKKYGGFNDVYDPRSFEKGSVRTTSDTSPIEVQMRDGKLNVVNGQTRLRQALERGDKSIKSFVMFDNKSQLEEIFKKATDATEAVKNTDYRIQHRITGGKSVSDLNNLDEIIKKHKETNGYITNYDQADIKKLKKMIGNPEMEVKIYRASPKNELNGGDWITTSKTYASDIKRQNGGKVHEYTVKAKDLIYPDDISELPSLARFSAFKYEPTQ